MSASTRPQVASGDADPPVGVFSRAAEATTTSASATPLVTAHSSAGLPSSVSLTATNAAAAAAGTPRSPSHMANPPRPARVRAPPGAGARARIRRGPQSRPRAQPSRAPGAGAANPRPQVHGRIGRSFLSSLAASHSKELTHARNDPDLARSRHLPLRYAEREAHLHRPLPEREP